jgi:hypothetical protein
LNTAHKNAKNPGYELAFSNKLYCKSPLGPKLVVQELRPSKICQHRKLFTILYLQQAIYTTSIPEENTERAVNTVSDYEERRSGLGILKLGVKRPKDNMQKVHKNSASAKLIPETWLETVQQNVYPSRSTTQ